MQAIGQTPTAAGGAQRPLRTLLVDDSAIFVSHLRQFLDGQSLIQVMDTASDGREAVNKAEALAPDLVLMDLHMPGMDGLQATAQLRHRLPNTRIIIMTLDETMPAQIAARAHGAHGFVDKTQMARTLMTEIQRVFELNPTGDEGGVS